MIHEREYTGEIEELPVTIDVNIEVTKKNGGNLLINLGFDYYEYAVTDWELTYVGNIEVKTKEQKNGFKALIGDSFEKHIERLCEEAIEEFQE